MENQPKALFQPQSFAFTHPLSLQMVEMSALHALPPPLLIGSLNYNFQILASQLESLRGELAQVRAEMEEAKQLVKRRQEEPSFVLLKGKRGNIRKEFTKHLDCPVDHCRNKYSSRIALRAHLRKAHPLPTSSSFIHY